jgi:hypothetical protein
MQSIVVDTVTGSDSGQLSFRVRINAEGIGRQRGGSQLGWLAFVSVDQQPIAEQLGSNEAEVYRLPAVDSAKYASPFSAHSDTIVRLVFMPKRYGFDLLLPVLSLTAREDKQLRTYLRGYRGDPSGFRSQIWRMIYLSAVVVTTLGLGDIVPITPWARWLVAGEAVMGIAVAGLFLNALSYRASNRDHSPDPLKKASAKTLKSR